PILGEVRTGEHQAYLGLSPGPRTSRRCPQSVEFAGAAHPVAWNLCCGGRHMFEILRTAELRNRGLSKRAANNLRRVPGIPGVRVLGDPPDDLRMLRVRAAWERAPAGAVLSGWAAAVVHGVEPEFLDGTTDGRTLRPV